MANDPYTPRALSPAEEIALGIRPPGPLAPVIHPGQPAQNLKNIEQSVNPTPLSPMEKVGKFITSLLPGIGNPMLQPYLSGEKPTPLSPKGFYGPGILAHAGSALGNIMGGQGTPEQAYSGSTPNLEMAANAATALLPAARGGILARAGMGGIQQMALAGLGGNTPEEMLKQGALGAGMQAGTEALLKIPNVFTAPSRAKAARSTFNTQVKTQEETYKAAQETYKQRLALVKDAEKEATRYRDLGLGKQADAIKAANKEALATAKAEFDAAEAAKKALVGQKNEIAKNVYAQAKGSKSEQAAASIMDDLKARNPAIDAPSTNEGLVDTIYGSGKEKVAKRFDDAMKVAKAKGANITLMVDPETAAALRVKPIPEPGIPGGKGPVLVEGIAPENKVPVNAADLIDGMTGKSGTPAYWEVADLLAESGIGTDAARAEYAAYRGYGKFIEKGKLLKKTGTLDTQAAEELLRTSGVEELRKRGLGHATEGPVTSVYGTPKAPKDIAYEPGEFTPPTPTPIPEPPASPLSFKGMAPEMPSEPSPLTPPDIGEIPLPPMAKFHIGAIPGAAIGGALGGWLPGGAGATAGGLLGMGYLPNELIYRAPQSPLAQVIKESADPIGDLVRAALMSLSNQNPSQMSTGD